MCPRARVLVPIRGLWKLCGKTGKMLALLSEFRRSPLSPGRYLAVARRFSFFSWISAVSRTCAVWNQPADWEAPFVGRRQWRRNVTWSSVTFRCPGRPRHSPSRAQTARPSVPRVRSPPPRTDATSLRRRQPRCSARCSSAVTRAHARTWTLVAIWASLRAWRRRTARTPSALRRTRCG